MNSRLVTELWRDLAQDHGHVLACPPRRELQLHAWNPVEHVLLNARIVQPLDHIAHKLHPHLTDSVVLVVGRLVAVQVDFISDEFGEVEGEVGKEALG